MKWSWYPSLKKLKGSFKYTLTWLELKDYVLWRNIAQNLQVCSCSNVDWVLKKTRSFLLFQEKESAELLMVFRLVSSSQERGTGKINWEKKFCSFFYHWGDLSISDRLLFPPLSVGSALFARQQVIVWKGVFVLVPHKLQKQMALSQSLDSRRWVLS